MKTKTIEIGLRQLFLILLLFLPTAMRATPTIVTPPTNTSVNVGSNVTFTVMATGTAPLNYRWQINGVGNFGSESSLTLTNVPLSYNGDLITVIVTDGLHQSITNNPAAVLTVLNPPQIAVQPQTLVVTAGNEALFEVSVNGGPPFSYQWQKNGTNITGAADDFLDLNPVADSDAAVYTVVVTNTDGSVLSAQAYLTVIEPALTATLPLATPVNTCTNITLSVITNGTDTNLSFQWFFGVDLTPVGSNLPNLTISDVEFTNAGLYTVQVSTLDGSHDYATGTLLVTNPPPVIVNGPADVTVQTGPGNTNCTQTATWTPPGVVDNCPGAMLTADHNPGDAFPVGTNLVTYTATDSGGQTARYSFHVIVQDTTPPVAVFNTIAVQLAAAGNYTLSASDVAAIANGSSDACSGISNSVNPSIFTFADVGSKQVTLTVTDTSGNQTATNGSITVMRPVAPPPVVYVDASYSGTGPVTFPNAGGTGAYYVGYNAFTSIQGGVNAVASMGTVHVAAGQYIEEVSISQPVNLFGPNATNNPNTGPRVPEAIILPDTSDPEIYSPTAVEMVSIASGNVIIKGFTVDGFNPAVSEVSDFDAASYSVTVTNAYGTNTSQPVSLTVLDPPAIVIQPVSATNNAGTTATFTVAASGTAPLRYQWKKGAAVLTNGGNVSGATSATLTIASVSDGDVAAYSVAITNAAGSTNSASAELTVIDPPAIAGQPASRTNNAGTTATFSVSVTGTAPFAFQWKKGAVSLMDGGNISGSTNATLTISGVQDADAGGYSVTISNPASSTNSMPATLTVIDPPVVVSGPASITNNAGTTASFTVTVDGTAPLFYRWFKNGTNQLSDSATVSGSASSVLTLSNVMGADRGDYFVVVTNAASTATSSNATLSVIDPYISVQPTNTKAIDGTTVSFTVTAVGTSPLSYRWRMDDFDLIDGFGINGSGTSTLTISKVADSDAANYSVVITNAAGEATSVEAQLTTVPSLIVFQPTNLYVLAGRPFSFSVGVNGTLPFTYQWAKDGSNIIGATNRTYLSPVAALEDSGTYSVEVSNPDGTETSGSARLDVFSSPGSVLYLTTDQNGRAIITLDGVTGFNYALQTTTNLSELIWTPLITNPAPFQFTDTNALPQRYYRSLYVP